MPTFDQLRTFRVIVQARTFSRAADELFLTQPAISQRVKHLEQALGVELFHRDGNRRSLRLTTAGERVLRFADEAILLLDQLYPDLKNASAAVQWETITIACSSTPAKYILPHILTVYYERHPYVRANVVQSLGAKIGAMIHAKDAELGIVTDKYLGRKLAFMPLLRDRLLLIASPDYPIPEGQKRWITGEDRLPFIMGAPNSQLRQVAEQWADSLHLKLEVLVETASLDFLKESVMHGLGLALAPEIVVCDEVRGGRLKIVPAPGMPKEWEFSLIFDSEHPLSPAAQAFLDVAREGAWRTYLPVVGLSLTG